MALIGPAWRAAGDDALAAELADAFAHRIPVVAMLMRKAEMPVRDALPTRARAAAGQPPAA